MNKDNRSNLGAYTVINAQNSTDATEISSSILDTINFDALFYTMAFAKLDNQPFNFVKLMQSDELELDNSGLIYIQKDATEVPADNFYGQKGLRGTDAQTDFSVPISNLVKVATLGVFGTKRYLVLYIQSAAGVLWSGTVNAFASELVVPVIASNAE